MKPSLLVPCIAEAPVRHSAFRRGLLRAGLLEAHSDVHYAFIPKLLFVLGEAQIRMTTY